MCKRCATALGAAVIVSAAGAASADMLDLTQAMSAGVINGVRFETADFRSAGTGILNSFVRIQATGTEEGYNTSGRPVPFDELTAGNFTRDLQLGEARVLDIEGVMHYEFLLDINQTNANSLLSLDQVQIYTSTIASQTTTNVPSLGTLVYDMDTGGDNWVQMDYALGSGSGQGDIRVLVPVAMFNGAPADTYVYLYSQFGTNIRSNDGFEEWAVLVPTPGSATLAAAGLLVAARRRRTR